MSNQINQLLAEKRKWEEASEKRADKDIKQISADDVTATRVGKLRAELARQKQEYQQNWMT